MALPPLLSEYDAADEEFVVVIVDGRLCFSGASSWLVPLLQLSQTIAMVTRISTVTMTTLTMTFFGCRLLNEKKYGAKSQIN